MVLPPDEKPSSKVQARAEALAAEWGCPLDALTLDAARLLVEAEGGR
jgi:hypothetical protein